MFKSQALRQAVRSTVRLSQSTSRASPTSNRFANNARSLTTSRALRSPSDEELDKATTSHPAGASGDHEGAMARTSGSVTFEHPEEENMPRSKAVRGSGGVHALPTLAGFSLEGKTCVITGGARGLGLVMAQAMVISGANVAIVDLNSAYYV
jgi:D-arabinitol 2-dehydrogenase